MPAQNPDLVNSSQTRLAEDICFLLACLKGEKAPRSLVDADIFGCLLSHHRIALAIDSSVLEDPLLGNILHTEQRRNRLQAMDRVAVLVETTKTLRAATIEPIWIKGPPLAKLLSGDPFRRPSRDLDFWVEEDIVPSALEALQSLGWQPVETRPLQHLKRIAHAITLHRPNSRTVLELHWRLATPDSALPIARLAPRRHAISVPIGDVEVTTLSLEAVLPYLAHHGTNHFWNRLFWLVDFQSAARLDIDWEQVIEIARQTGVLKRLAFAFLAAEHLLGSPVPSLIRQQISPSWKLEQKLHLLAEAFTVPPEIDTATMYRVGLWRYVFWDMSLRDNWGSRFAVIAQKLRVTEKDEHLLQGKPWLAPLLPLARLARVGARSLRTGTKGR
ncbi:MAG: nucleotidyltransferase family protein [Alphaproteobacteria bacterium]|nr:nucleotidyltransferase family protein [Alphaproteobacteria bacterium]MBU0796816.1 nucleotidyltransferase family protein [Alphaproteobacteria bacterium]MBU0885826.1 nucleotidyltransferase family protein [Alphaproteobacteria bacterium]MBU1812097.1 nucleotidyltransferase family protein [Alphaproteobacteria bacterium]MBU2091526.1 nucleotidyltransferase family protein [Alphaproteobacteria bacterium]